MLKNAARKFIVAISWTITRRFIQKKKPILIGVVGSVGKTGTKRAIASVLSAEYKVAWQDGNYNDLVSVPLIFFDLEMPSLFNPFSWIVLFIKMKIRAINSNVQVVVLELGTDGKGQIAEFGKYITLDYAVVTAISHEHMENFGNLQSVADEEFAVKNYSKTLLISSDTKKYLSDQDNKNINVLTYGSKSSDDVKISSNKSGINIKSEELDINVTPKLHGEHQFWALGAAAQIAFKVGMNSTKISEAIENIQSMPGRMNLLEGKDNSLIIDDTYNSSPSAVEKALEYLYNLPQKNKIAVLGNMNEMGELSSDLHIEVAKKCDPKKLKLLITIGPDANNYLANEAKFNGCKVETFNSPFDIGDFLKEVDLTDTAILFKGSQNGVFLEEAVKKLLHDSSDSRRLVRQSTYWLKVKKKQFGE